MTIDKLHGLGKPAIQFSDGYSLYAYHGNILPEKYGKVKPEKWESRWILSEKNVELRRLLILEIGYDRISCELEAEQVDNWKEYNLLRFKFNDGDAPGFEPDANPEPEIKRLQLLTMVCPST
ncbi:MAG: DUF6745 domain-containing protein [Microcoleaceae cyanobacterium]